MVLDWRLGLVLVVGTVAVSMIAERLLTTLVVQKQLAVLRKKTSLWVEQILDLLQGATLVRYSNNQRPELVAQLEASAALEPKVTHIAHLFSLRSFISVTILSIGGLVGVENFFARSCTTLLPPPFTFSVFFLLPSAHISC